LFTITERAAHFYKKEMELNSGDALRLYVRYGGYGKDGFSIGIEKSDVKYAIDGQEIEGITFFAHPDDRWFVDLVTMDADENLEDVIFSYS
jgi:uncharacterized protein YneR